MTTVDIRELLRELLEEEGGFEVRTYEEEGVLTRDEGLVLRTEESEFYLTIVKSR